MFSKNKRTHTRELNPWLGMLGLLGFLGFTGFIPILWDLKDRMPVPFPFCFFAFFGFFGFYYEGKMSNTLIDERFESNSYRATAIANQRALNLIIWSVVIASSLFKVTDTYIMLSVIMAVIGLAFGLSVFWAQYLLYQYEREE